MNWKREADTTNHYKFTVTYTAGLRYSFPYGGPGNCAGVPVSGPTGTGSCPPLGQVLGNSALGNVVFVHPTTSAAYGVRFNNEAAGLVSSVSLSAAVTKIVPAQDLMYVAYTFTVFVPKSQTIMPRVRWSNSARLSTLLEAAPNGETNRDSNWSVESVLNLVAQQSPEAIMVATVPVKHNQLNTIVIPTTAEPGSTVELSIAPAAESLLPKTTPTNFSFSNASPNTILFTPPAVGHYAVQLKATSYDANHNVLASAPFEFLLQSTNCTVNCPNVVLTTADATPTVEIGQTLNFSVNASAGNMTPTAITIDSTPLPAGMTFSQSGSGFPSRGHSYMWTPSAPGSYPVCFQGIAGVTNSQPLCVVINAIVHNDPPVAACSAPLLGVAAQGPTGALANVFATVSDPDLNAITLSWTVNGVPAGFQSIPGGSGSTQADLNVMFPIGTSTVEATVSDGFTSTSCTTTVSVDKLAQVVTLNAPPSVPFGTPSVALTTSAQSGNPVSLQLISGPATLAGNTLTITGVGEIIVKASANGNAIYLPGTASASIFVVDVTAPVISMAGLAPVEATSASGAVVTYSASALDNVDGAVAPSCVPASGSVFPLGTSSIVCTAADAALNSATMNFSAIVRDTTAPSIDAHATVTAEAGAGGAVAVTYAAPATTDVVSGPGLAECLPASGSMFALGTTMVTCSATDAAGNTSAASFAVIVDDTTPPSIAAQADLTVEAVSGAGAPASYVTPIATDLVNGPVAVTCAPVSGSLFAPGATLVTCTASDAKGNTASSSFTVRVSDSIAPSISAHGNESAEATSAAGAIVTYISPLASDSVDGSVSVSCVPATGSTFAIGTSTVTCTAADAAGNNASSSFTVTVADTTAPVIAAHADITVNATSAAGATVSYIAPVTTDTVDGSGAAICAPAAGSFPIGTTTVTCTASDARGNAAASTSFNVTVVNNAPSITPLADVTAEATGAAGAVVTFASAGSDIEDGPLTGICTPASGSTFAIGTTAVTCTVTDVTSASASDSFNVTVRDTTAPAVTVASVTVPATSASGAVVSYAASAIDLVNGAVAVSCTPASGSTFGLGTTAVTCTATDAAGNTGTGTGNVTVSDGMAPVVTYTGNAGTYNVAQTVNITCGATDIGSGVASTTCANISGPAYTFALGVNTFSATATDHAGNVGSGSTSFTVVVTSQSLRQLVLAWVSNSGIANALVNKLDQADRAPNANARRGMVGAFENQLSGQIGKTITAAHAATILQLLHALYP